MQWAPAHNIDVWYRIHNPLHNHEGRGERGGVEEIANFKGVSTTPLPWLPTGTVAAAADQACCHQYHKTMESW